MKITVGELKDVIDDITKVMYELDKISTEACTDASGYLQDYIDLLCRIEVNI